jgi:integrase
MTYRDIHAPVLVFPLVFIFSGVGTSMKLTDTKVRNAKIGKSPVSLSDGGGLYLHITPAGGKLWRYNYRIGAKQKTITFGRYPEISLAEAREKHIAARRVLASGVDPMEQRKAEKAASKVADEHSFQSIALLWHEHWKVGKSFRHTDTVLRRLQGDVFPAIGSKPVTEIEAPAVVSLVKAIEGREAYDLAKRALETVGQIFRYAVAHGYCKRNPASDIKPGDILKSVRKVNYARVNAKELPGLLRAVEVYRGTPITRLAIKLMAHTFVRTSELIGARWEEINLEEKRWDIPASRMKMKTPHIVPLSRQAVEILELLQQLTGHGALLFPGERDAKRHMSNNTILVALSRMGYKGVMTGHGFRGLASTILHEQGWPHDHIELQLAHAPRNAVSASYNHALYLEPRSKMLQAWSDYLEQTQRGGKVFPFHAGAA